MSGLYKNTKEDLRFYFLHEYYFDACEESDVEATANYEGEYACSVRRGNIFMEFSFIPKRAIILECNF